MGISLLYRQKVTTVIAVKLGNSLFLMIIAWVLSGLIGFLLGSLAGMNRGKPIDKIIKGYCLVISSTPAFWIAMLLLIIFGVWLKILPIGLSVPIGVEASGVTFFDRVRHAILPAVTLSITGISNIAMHTREKMIDICDSDYVLFAKARGESSWQIFQKPWFPQCPWPGRDTSVCFDQRDLRRLSTCGAGLFLSGTWTGSGQCRSWK